MSNNDTKRRKVGADGATISPKDSNNYDGLVCEELKDIKSTMNEMMEHTRLQTQNMTNMMQMMKSMQWEIAHLTNECNEMKHIIHETKDKCVDNGTSISTMNSRFDDVGNKLQYHEVLLENQKWKYSVPRPSQEYWNGVEGDEHEAAKDFLTQVKQYTEEMRYGTGDGDITINAILPYNEQFSPHWKEFANALEQYQYRLKCLPGYSDTKFRLWDMELPDTVIELLSKSLESTHVTNFILGNNSLGQSGIDFALKYLKSNCILKVFGLVGNPIEKTKVKQLCQIVEGHPSIEKLYLGECADVDWYEMLQMIMTAGKYKLKAIDLSGNGISTGGDTFISDFLADNFVLNDLNLSRNELDDNDAIAIAGALKHNTHLRTLDLRYNRKMTGAGFAALRKAEFDETSLNSVADSNHICLIEYPFIRGLHRSEMNGDPDSGYCFAPDYVRQKKIYSVLSSRNRQCSNVGHFDDVPVELLPVILSSIERYSEYHIHDHAPPQSATDVKPISLVFEILQRWDKSLAVFESLSS